VKPKLWAMTGHEEVSKGTFDLNINDRGFLQRLAHIFEVTLRASLP
jgi:hypothetical protein